MIDTQIHTRHRPGIARIRRIAVALTALLGSTSCEKVNPYWCEGHPKNDCRLDGGTAGDVGGSEPSQRDLDGDPRQNPPDIGADEAP